MKVDEMLKLAELLESLPPESRNFDMGGWICTNEVVEFAECFGLTLREAKYLFMPSQYGDLQHISPRTVAERVRWLVAKFQSESGATGADAAPPA